MSSNRYRKTGVMPLSQMIYSINLSQCLQHALSGKFCAASKRPPWNEQGAYCSVPMDSCHRHLNLVSLYGAATRLIIPVERGTFQDSAAKLFDVLPANKVYCWEVDAYLLDNICKQFVNCIQGCIAITNLYYILFFIQYPFIVRYYCFL